MFKLFDRKCGFNYPYTLNDIQLIQSFSRRSENPDIWIFTAYLGTGMIFTDFLLTCGKGPQHVEKYWNISDIIQCTEKIQRLLGGPLYEI